MIKDIRALRSLMIMLVTVLVFSGAASAYEGASKRVEIKADGKVISVNTTKDTVGEVLDSNDVVVLKEDSVIPPVTEAVEDNMTISVERAFMVTIMVDGVPKHLRVGKGTLKTAIDKLEESIEMETNLVGANESDELKPNMIITLVTRHTEITEVSFDLPFEVTYVENNDVEKGKETVITEGVNGTGVTVYENVYEGMNLVSSTPVETKTIAAPVNKVVEIGTYELTVPGTNLRYSKVITMRASAYTTDRGDAGPITATGERARVGLVAVDPKFIPLGTRLYVVGYGECRAADTGGMIKGNAIDLFFNTYDEMTSFGRREVTVYVLE